MLVRSSPHDLIMGEILCAGSWHGVISNASKIILIILQARLQQHMNCELQIFKLDLEKAEEVEIKLPTSIGSLKMEERSSKTSTSVLLTMPKPLTVWITTNCGKFLKR